MARLAMPAALHLVLALTAATELSYAGPRSPIIVHVLASRADARPPPVSSYLAALDAALHSRTDLTVRSLEQAGIDASAIEACPPELRLSCWSRTAQTASGYFLVIAVQPETKSSGAHALSTILIDLDDARRALADPDPESVEDLLFSSALRTEPVSVRDTVDAELAAHFRSLVENDFRATFERKKHWRLHGTLELELLAAGARLDLDGAALSTVPLEGRLVVRDLPEGTHTLKIRWPSGREETHSIHVDASAPAQLSAGSEEIPRPMLRPALFWSGLGVAIAGAAVTTIAIAKSGAPLRAACLVRPGASADACEELGTPTFAWSPENAPSTQPDEINPSGLAVAPLGISLLAAGLTWSAGAWVFGAGDDDTLWITLAAGIVSGGLAYGTGALIGAR